MTLLSQLQIKTWIKQNKGPKRIENKIQLVCIKDLKNTCYRPKNDNERSKNVAEDGKSLNSALSQLVSEIGRKFVDKRVNFIDFSIIFP